MQKIFLYIHANLPKNCTFHSDHYWYTPASVAGHKWSNWVTPHHSPSQQTLQVCPWPLLKCKLWKRYKLLKCVFFMEIFPVFTFYSPAHSIHLIHTIWPSLSFSQYIGPLPKFLVDDDGGVEYDIEWWWWRWHEYFSRAINGPIGSIASKRPSPALWNKNSAGGHKWPKYPRSQATSDQSTK